MGMLPSGLAVPQPLEAARARAAFPTSSPQCAAHLAGRIRRAHDADSRGLLRRPPADHSFPPYTEESCGVRRGSLLLSYTFPPYTEETCLAG
jgi:hypothetical protein